MTHRSLLGLLSLAMMMASCGPTDKGFQQYWVIAPKLDILRSATKAPEVLGTLAFGDEVWGREPNLGVLIPKEWLEVKVGKERGYVNRTNLGDKATLDELSALKKGVGESQVQGIGETNKRTPFRLRPSRSAKLVELLKKPAKIEIFERIVVDKEGATGKEVWYKARLEDGRVGYVPDTLRLVPPKEINQYTAIRKPIAWLELREKEEPTTGAKCKEYVVAYVSEGTPIDVDYSRIELYTCDPKSGQYATSLARSALLGKLPLVARDAEEGGKILELRLIPKNKPGKLLVQEYSFPSPIKMVREYEIERST